MTGDPAAAHDGRTSTGAPTPSGLPTLGVIVSAMLLGSAGLFVILAEATTPTVAFLRCWIAVVVLAPLAILELRRHGRLPTKALLYSRVHKLLKASHTPNPAACVEDVRYLPDRTLTRDVVDRLASCAWIENATNVIILGKTSVGKSYLAQASVNAACWKDYTVAY